MDIHNYKRTKLSCYFTYVAMSTVFCLPPLLFVTFREMYNISYTLLGTLVLVNFCTQMVIDLIFTFFAKHFNIHMTVKIMPLITSAGLLVYAIGPMVYPRYAYAGFLIGTLLFSVAAGLSEVLLSPMIAAIPSEHPDKDMSILHSLYGWGVFGVVIISTLFLKIFGRENWMYLTMILATLPVVAAILFAVSPMPEMNASHAEHTEGSKRRALGLALCIGCIFFGSAAENTMSNWISGYMENALQIPKEWGDIFGTALFAILLASGRSLYAKYGRNITNVLLYGMIGSVVCYLAAGLSGNVILSFLACVFTGCCTSMLWPGTLILMEEKIPNPGITAYALMAAGGDLGASIAPQLLGVIVDTVSESRFAFNMSEKISLSTEQIGMKVGMLSAAIFPIIGTCLLIFMKQYFRSQKSNK